MAHWLDTVCPVGWICLEMALLVGGGVAHWLEMALLVGGGVAYRLEMALLVGGGVAHWLEMKLMVGGGMAHWLEVAWFIGWRWLGSLVRDEVIIPNQTSENPTSSTLLSY